MTDIIVDNLKKTYDNDTEALSDVSLEISNGEFYGILGQNGAGKTTLINVLTGQIQPEKGEVSVLNVNPVEKPAKSRDMVGILPEKESPLSFLTPNEYFEFVGKVRGVSTEDIDSHVEKWSKEFDIDDKLNTLNRNLSRGQQQKVMLISTFIHNPKLVFIDEPLVNLDPQTQDKVKKFLKNYNEKGNTIVLSTHYTEAAAELCEKIGIMNQGEIVDEISVDDLESHDEVRDKIIQLGE